jgi:hypothetical protein
MHIPSTIRTSHGPRSLPMRPMLRVSLTRDELQHVITGLQREAAEHERDGRDDIAVRLHWRCADLREAYR